MSSSKLTILDLPEDIVELILSHLSYDEIAKCRAVCKVYNELCQQLLNKGFKSTEKSCTEYLNFIKPKLPRRVSEKNGHHFLPACYVLESVKASLTKLSFVYDKYIQANECCFIPGKIIDETLEILRQLKVREKSGKYLTFPNVQSVLKEFNDIKVLAIEHFEEKIRPGFEDSSQGVSGAKGTQTPRKNVSESKTLVYFDKVQEYIKKFEKQESKMREYLNIIERQQLQMEEYAMKVQNQDSKIKEYAERIKHLNSKIQENAEKIKSQDLQLQEHSGKIQSQSAQLAQVTKTLNDLNTKLRSLGITLMQN